MEGRTADRTIKCPTSPQALGSGGACQLPTGIVSQSLGLTQSLGSWILLEVNCQVLTTDDHNQGKFGGQVMDCRRRYKGGNGCTWYTDHDGIDGMMALINTFSRTGRRAGLMMIID